MKKMSIVWVLTLAFLLHGSATHAQIPILDIIKGAVKKVIKAMDLQIQRQQNKVIWLQNAQKVMENTMSELKLDEITGWVDKQKTLYQDYYIELAKVKSLIATYQRVKTVIKRQQEMVGQYSRAWSVLRQDKHFSPEELDHMQRVYSGLLEESIKGIDQITLVITSFSTTMSDAKRMEIIEDAAVDIEAQITSLSQFTNQNILLSLHRTKSAQEIKKLKVLYGLD